nr:MAG TPA: hypothetical protein [Caudoviricetes sp.]
MKMFSGIKSGGLPSPFVGTPNSARYFLTRSQRTTSFPLAAICVKPSPRATVASRR